MKDSRTLARVTTTLSRQLEAWRSAHSAPTPIPSELWERAVELADQQGLYKTARALRLDYGALKKRSETRSRMSSHTGVRFLECFLPAPATIGKCALEVESSNGGKLRVELRDVPTAGLVSILREFTGVASP